MVKNEVIDRKKTIGEIHLIYARSDFEKLKKIKKERDIGSWEDFVFFAIINLEKVKWQAIKNLIIVNQWIREWEN